MLVGAWGRGGCLGTRWLQGSSIPPSWRGLEVLRYFGSSIACSNMLMGFPTALGWAELSVKHLSVSHLQLVTNDLKLLIFCAVTQTRRGSFVIIP